MNSNNIHEILKTNGFKYTGRIAKNVKVYRQKGDNEASLNVLVFLDRPIIEICRLEKLDLGLPRTRLECSVEEVFTEQDRAFLALEGYSVRIVPAGQPQRARENG